MLDFVQIINSLIKYLKFHTSSTKEPEFKDFVTQKLDLNTAYSKMNSTPLADLCLVDSVIFDKTGTMTVPQFKIKLLLINETFFEIHHKTFKN